MRLILVLAGSLSLVMMSGCGSSSVTPTMTGSQARALAHAINLTAADVPGFAVSSEASISPAANQESERCAGEVPDSKALAVVYSPTLARSATKVSPLLISRVTVFPTAKLAQLDLVALHNGRLRRCAVLELTRLLMKRGAPLVRVSSTLLLAPVPGGLGLRFTLRTGREPTEFSDSFQFVRGNVLVSLLGTSWPRPFSVGFDGRLTSILVARAKQYIP